MAVLLIPGRIQGFLTGNLALVDRLANIFVNALAGVNRRKIVANARLAAVEGLRATGAYAHQRCWSLGTSSNYSVVIDRDPFRLLVTASGKHKEKLSPTDFVVLDASGKQLEGEPERPSAEVALHLMLGQRPGVGSILHTHSVWGTLLSDLYGPEGGFFIEGFEMLKGLSGIKTHEHRQWVEIFPNTQDIPDLAKRVAARLDDRTNPLRHGFLIERHGLYTWGQDLQEATRHIEIFEFLFEVVGRRLAYRSGHPA
jgi:methylthioribulose-1-phosphate dehydratase